MEAVTPYIETALSINVYKRRIECKTKGLMKVTVKHRIVDMLEEL